MTTPGRDPTALVLEGTNADPGLLGGKGAALDRLIGWGLPVPDTGVVTASAYRAVAGLPGPAALLDRLAAGEDCRTDEIDRAFDEAEPPAAIRTEIVALGRRIGAGRRLAIRSSATVEDLAHSSFAGLYRSVLDVDSGDDDAIVAAVLSVFASLWHPPARAYRHALGIDDGDAAMAVVIMAIVPAERAGVTFTVDPADDSGRARIEAVVGRADTLVSGDRTPDVWQLERTTERPDLPADIAAALRESLRIESLAGSPQDVEWAWDGAALWVVQARPITTAEPAEDGDGFDSAAADAELTTAGIGEMLPGVLPPLLWEVNSHLVDHAFRAVLDGLGLPVEQVGRGGLLRRVRGRATLDYSALHQMATRLPGGAADELERQYFGSRRSGRPAAPRAAPDVGRIAAARHDLRVLVQQHRAIQDAEIVRAAIGALRRRRPPLEQLDDAALVRYRFRLVDLGVRAMTAELGSAAAAAAAYRRLELTLASWVDSAEAGRLAGLVTAQAGVTAVPEPHASAAVFAGPTWDETGRVIPAPTAPAAGTEPVDGVHRRLDTLEPFGPDAPLGWLRRRRLDRAVDTTIDHLRRRELTKAAVLELGGEVRRVHLELGERLRVRRALEVADDVDLLTWGEVAAGLRGHGPAMGQISRRRRWIRRYRDEGPLPVRFRGRPERNVAHLPPGDRLEGWAASAGRCTDRAVFLTTPDGHLPTGGILLAEATDSSWSPIFVRAGAIVLERGGPLSHAAILARELAVPAVLNVGAGIRALDGRMLTVDGSSGTVVVHHDPAPGPGNGSEADGEDR